MVVGEPGAGKTQVRARLTRHSYNGELEAVSLGAEGNGSDDRAERTWAEDTRPSASMANRSERSARNPGVVRSALS